MPFKSNKDQMGRDLSAPFPPKRIISLVPSQTELLGHLGLDQEVVGITKFCLHPDSWRKSKAVIGGTKYFNFDVIHSLRPDLIIGNKEENYQEGIEKLGAHYPVWLSDVTTLKQALGMIQGIAELTGKEVEGINLINELRKSLSEINPFSGQRVLYLIWRDPWMVAASGTFIHEMLAHAGFKNCLSNRERYPKLTSEDLGRISPDVIFLSSEPYPFKEKHINEIRSLCPNAKVVLVDGEMFSWYGSRLLHFTQYIEKLRTQLA